ncbi:MAG: S41 family peptidase [Maribacter sp.]
MKKSLVTILCFHLCSLNILGQSTVLFKLESLPLVENQKVGIRGNLPPLSWENSIPLIAEEGTFTVKLDFPNPSNDLEFKFVLSQDNEETTWENIENRTLRLVKNEHQVSDNTWNREQIVDISTLKPISSKKLLDDYELISEMVLNVHPGTFRYNTTEEITVALKELKTKFGQPLSYQEAYLSISKLTAQLKCDHTKAGFNNQNKIINSIIHFQKDKVPFTFKWIDNEMVVTNNASQDTILKRGTKIISINQVPVLEIRNKILPYIGADGATDKNRIYKSEVNGYDFRYNAFDIFYSLLYPLKSNQMELEVQQLNSPKIESIKVSSVSRETRILRLIERYPTFPKSRDDLWQFEIIANNVAKLTINSFGLNGWKAMTIDYKAFLSNAFDTLVTAEIEHLIIDIRENTGGSDEMANELFQYLAKTNINFEREGRTRYITFPEKLRPFVKTWGDNPWYFNLSPKIKEPTDGYYIFKDAYDQPKRKSAKKIFKGKTYLITSAANTSLAYYTAATFKLQNLGLLVGEETGGNLNDINGGQILFLKLPNSNIEIDFPVMGAFSSNPQPDKGITPDIHTSYTLKDFIENKDLEVEKIMLLLKK